MKLEKITFGNLSKYYTTVYLKAPHGVNPVGDGVKPVGEIILLELFNLGLGERTFLNFSIRA